MKARITLAYDPNETQYGASLKDKETNSIHFGPADLMKAREGDMLDVERSERKPNPKFPGTKSYNITSWEIYGSGKSNHPNQKELPIRPPSTRPRTDPHDQKQIFMGLMMKSWNAAYAQFLSITPGDMKKVDAVMVQQAMGAYSTSYDQFYGSMTQSNKPPVEDDMNDSIPDF